MASTRAPIEASDLAQKYVKNMPFTQQVGVAILGSANNYIWMAAPWRWTLGALPAVTVTNLQDYPIALPADFLYTVDVYQTDSAGNTPRHLDIVPALPPNGLIGAATSIAYTGPAGSTGNVRLSPVPPAQTPGSTQTLIGLYKKTAPVLTASNIYTPGILVMDDEWWWVYEAVVRYFAYLYGDDQRAGTAEFAGGQAKYTGQLGVVEGNIQMMRDREKLPLQYNKPEPKKDK